MSFELSLRHFTQYVASLCKKMDRHKNAIFSPKIGEYRRNSDCSIEPRFFFADIKNGHKAEDEVG
jgi:hypothetical protein